MLCVLFLFTFCSYAVGQGPLLRIPLGKIQGFWSQSYDNRTFSGFYGIPYAQPPLGNLRFRDPLPVLPWEDIWIANATPICPQLRYRKGYSGDEDCLYLNIQVPFKFPQSLKQKLPVIFDIHGGAFMGSNGRAYAGPHYMMDRDVILVTLSYRLGPLGFLSTEDSSAPGNFGMKDQVAALKFVNRYISYFGGNPKEITITGMSAGGASVHYHFLSPMTHGLFKSGISFSGAALNPWTLQKSPLEKAFRLGKYCGCVRNDTASLIRCLRRRPAKTILEHVPKFQIWLDNPFNPFGLVVEQNSSKAFLPAHPYQLLNEGKVKKLPWLTTVTTDEGLYPAAEFLDVPDGLKYLEDNWLQLCPSVFDFYYSTDWKRYEKTCSKIKEFYLHNQTVSNQTFPQVVKAMTDRLFAVGIEHSAKLQAMHGGVVFAYRYNYTAEKQPSFAHRFSDAPRQGVCHGDDITMIFSDNKKPLVRMSPNDEKIKNILLDLIISFSNEGKPIVDGVEFEPVDMAQTYLKYLLINSPHSMEMKLESTIAFNYFWESLKLTENGNIY